MKTDNFIVLSLLGLAAAQPHGHQRHARFHQEHKRDLVTDTVTVVETAPAAIVIVDPEGKPVATSYLTSSSAASVQAAAATPASQDQNAAPASYSWPSWKSSQASSPATSAQSSTSSPPPPATTSAPSPTSTTPQPVTSTTSPSGGYIAPSASPSSGLGGYGVSYAPYNADGTCRSAQDVSSDIAALKGFGWVRSYGVDCNQVPNMLAAAKANGMKIMLGIYDLSALDSEIATLVSGVGNDWDAVHSVSIGNEDVNDGTADVPTVVAATNSGRSQLRAAGFTGPVVHVDTFNQVIDNPDLCLNSDYAAANCHAFFDPNTAAPQAGNFVSEQAQKMASLCGGKEVIITESGWPHGGDTNGDAVPSPANQQAALSSLKSAFSNNIVFFSAYDDLWKQDTAGTFGAEHFWGMFDQGDDITGF